MPELMGFPKELHPVEKAGVAEKSHCMLTVTPTLLLGYFPTSNQADKTGVKMNLGKQGKKGVISVFVFLFSTTQVSSCIFILVGKNCFIYFILILFYFSWEKKSVFLS